MVIPTFVRQALLGEPITVFGDGTQRRCFTWVGDAVAGLVALMDHEGALGEIFNVGSKEEISIGALAELVKDLTASSSPIVSVPYGDAYGDGFEDVPRRVPDLTKIEALVGYAPKMSVEDMVRSVVRDLGPRSIVVPAHRGSAAAVA
jgi:UDP-glucose 4-epimerase